MPSHVTYLNGLPFFDRSNWITEWTVDRWTEQTPIPSLMFLYSIKMFTSKQSKHLCLLPKCLWTQIILYIKIVFKWQCWWVNTACYKTCLPLAHYMLGKSLASCENGIAILKKYGRIFFQMLLFLKQSVSFHTERTNCQSTCKTFK